MKITHISYLAILSLLLTSCWIEAVDGSSDPGNGEEVVFENVSSSNLPTGALSNNSTEVAAVDLNQDGAPDLVIAVEAAPNKLLINNGNGVFSDQSNSRFPGPRNLASKDVAVANLDADNFPDIFFVNDNTQANELYLNNQDNTFSDASGRIPIQDRFNAVDVADVNGDGALDILIGNLGQNELLINNGNARFTNQTFERLPQRNDGTRDVVFADIDRDGDSDIIVGNEDANRILINDGNGFFTDETSRRLPLQDIPEITHDVNLADIDNNGNLDLYFGNVATSGSQADPQDRLLINNGNGFFEDVTGSRLPENDFNTVGADFADINNDGNPDLLVGDIEGGIQLLINDGVGSFTDETEEWLPENFSPQVLDFSVADFNGDGLPDIYIGNFQSTDNLLIQQDQ